MKTFQPTDRRDISPGERAGIEELRGETVEVLRTLPDGMYLVRFPSDFELPCYPEEIVESDGQ